MYQLNHNAHQFSILGGSYNGDYKKILDLPRSLMGAENNVKRLKKALIQSELREYFGDLKQ